MAAVRLQKALADAGVCSRRHAEELIAAGRVAVDGAVVRELGTRVEPSAQRIEVDGRPLAAPQASRTFLADKPRGILCTSSDPQGRPTILEWARANGLPKGRFFTIGRLDYDSEGLILLTTDGALAQRMGHPSHHAEKEYRVWVPRLPGRAAAAAMLRGVEDEGECLRALSVEAEAPMHPGWPPSVRLVLGEGRNRHIRRMLGALGIRILRLRRIRIGELDESLLRGRPLVPVAAGRLGP